MQVFEAEISQRLSVEALGHTFETTDSREARRCRLALFSGRAQLLVISGMRIVGKVYAVKVDETAKSARWKITVL